MSARAKSRSLAKRLLARLDRIPFRVRFALVCVALGVVGGAGVLIATGTIEIGASRRLMTVAVSSVTLRGLRDDLPSLYDPQDIKSIDVADMDALTHPCFPAGVPKRFAAGGGASPPNVFESVTPFRAAEDRPRGCSVAVAIVPSAAGAFSLRSGGGKGCSSTASIALTPSYVEGQKLCETRPAGGSKDVAFRPHVPADHSLTIMYASATTSGNRPRVIFDNYGAGPEAALEVDSLELQLAEPLPDKKCAANPGQTIVIQPKFHGTVALDRLGFDQAGLRASIGMSGPHTLAVLASGTSCESDERSVTPWKLVAIAGALVIAFVQVLVKFVEGLMKILFGSSEQKGKGR